MHLVSLGKHQRCHAKAVNMSCVMAIIWCMLALLGQNLDQLLFNKQFSTKNS